MIKTNKKKLSYKKKIKKTRKNLSYKKKLKKSRKNMKKNRKFFGGDPEHEIPFLLKQAFEDRGKYLPNEISEKILKDVPKESIKKAITMADYKKSLAERKQKIETLKKIYPELLKKYKELIKENKIQFQKMDSIMRSRRMSNDERIQNTNKFYKLGDQDRKLNFNMFRLNEISEDFEKIKNKDLDYFLGLQDDESYLTPKPYVKFP